MAELTVDRTYGTALFEAAGDLGIKDEILEETVGLMELFEKEPDLATFMKYPSIPAREKKEVIKNIFEGRIDDVFLNFLYVLVDKGRTTHLQGILKMYIKLIDEEAGFTNGIVYSVVPLGEDKIKELEEETSKLLRKNVKLTNELDTDLIGGVKILAEGKLIDLSYRKRLEDLGNQIHLV
ncbi:MAG: ATP synthase F1 subunit delta [Prevotellaceae bacterium]|nr:ATP synthase F1 subunit delta [Prevotellaceae bacterium]